MPATERDQRGQVVTALVVMVFAAILAVVVVGLIPLGQATDESSQASNAADAAALGAANVIRGDLLDRVSRLRYEDLDRLGRTGPCSLGRDGAEEYAARNSAMVTDYCYFPSEDRIEVGVQLRSTGVDGAPARARAAASPGGLNVSSCRRWDDPRPTTTTTPTPPTTAAEPIIALPPPPTYPPGTELRCDGVVLRFSITSGGRAELVPPGLLARVLVPRLVA